MCGRYASSRRADDLVAEYGVDWVAPSARVLEPDYNVAPTKDVLAVLDRLAAVPGERPTRELRTMRWGLVPSWAADPGVGRLINARLETVAAKPAFRSAFAARRALLPADGYYEWYSDAGNQPHFLHREDGAPMAMAALYERWHPAGPTDPTTTLWTATIITTSAQDAVGHLHDRMPVLLERANWDAWLDPGCSDVEVLHRLLAPGAGRLHAYPVGTAVGSVAANGPQLVRPVAAEPVQGRLL